MTDLRTKPRGAIVPQKQTTAVSVVSDYGADCGAGFEGTGARDLSIPFLAILQQNSPQLMDKTLHNLTAGQVFNTVTKESYPEEAGVAFVPVHKEATYVEWVPRDHGGGFVGLHDPSSDVVRHTLAEASRRKTSKHYLDNGNELIETHYVYGLTLDQSGKRTTGFAVIAFTSTKLKVFRDWMTSMYMLKGRPPIFANRVRIKTVLQSNNKGNFYNFKIEPFTGNWLGSLISPTTEASLLEEAKDFRQMVVSGLAKAAFDSQGNNQEDTEGSDDVPF